jgi:small GTP-binding protein
MGPEKDEKDDKRSEESIDELKARLERLSRKDKSRDDAPPEEELINEDRPRDEAPPVPPRPPRTNYPKAPRESDVPTIDMEPAEQMEIIKKICLIGDSGVGKKTILGKVAPFRKDWEHYANTIGTTITKYVQSYTFVTSDVNLLIMVWDITGRENFLRMQPSYYKGSEGLMVMADASDIQSIENIPKWIRAAYKITDMVPTVVVVNKIDLIPEDQRKALDRKVREVLKGYEVPLFYTTVDADANALTGPFHTLAELISERVKLQLAKKRYKKYYGKKQ